MRTLIILYHSSITKDDLDCFLTMYTFYNSDWILIDYFIPCICLVSVCCSAVHASNIHQYFQNHEDQLTNPTIQSSHRLNILC